MITRRGENFFNGSYFFRPRSHGDDGGDFRKAETARALTEAAGCRSRFDWRVGE